MDLVFPVLKKLLRLSVAGIDILSLPNAGAPSPAAADGTRGAGDIAAAISGLTYLFHLAAFPVRRGSAPLLDNLFLNKAGRTIFPAAGFIGAAASSGFRQVKLRLPPSTALTPVRTRLLFPLVYTITRSFEPSAMATWWTVGASCGFMGCGGFEGNEAAGAFTGPASLSKAVIEGLTYRNLSLLAFA